MSARRPLAALLGGVLASAALPNGASALAWADLWQRPDQRAQQLLNAGDPAAAAPLFEDPRRRGYAQLRAQQFDAAAKQLQDLTDPESLYNRGNALAHAGDLKAALDAYDAALAAAPPQGSLRKDAQHNRDLVAKQLESQPPQAKQDSSKDKDKDKDKGKDGDKDHAQKGESQGDKDQPQDASNPPKPADPQHPQDQKSQAGQQAQQNPQNASASNPQAGQAGQPQSPKDGQQTASPPAPAPDKAAPSGAEPKQDSAASALADARAGLQNRPPPAAPAAPTAPAAPAKMPSPAQAAQAQRDARAQDRASAVDEPPKPLTEQQLALEQWLRWIPDDPAGLLRRKFLIEHMLKQQEAQRP